MPVKIDYFKGTIYGFIDHSKLGVAAMPSREQNALKAPAPRGRPPKDPVARAAWEEARLAAKNAATEVQAKAEKARARQEVIDVTLKKLDYLARMVAAAVAGKVRSMIVTGAPGIGKTYTAEAALKSAPEPVEKGVRRGVVKAVVTPVNLYKLLWRFRKPGSVLILDDADSIFEDDDSLNLLKAATDTSSDRILSYYAESKTLKDEGIPLRFRFEGALIFLSNINIRRFLSFGRSKSADHMRALIDRAFWLDMDLHARDEVAIWVDYSVRERNILTTSHGLNAKQADELLKWIMQDPDLMSTLSLRTVVKGATLVREWPEDWRDMASTFLRDGQ